MIMKRWVRHWRIAEVRLLFLALMVSVVAVTSVSFFADRANQAMLQQVTQLMGGDLVVRSSRPIPDAYRTEASQRGLKLADVISFPSVVSVDDSSKLARIIAVSEQYPLQGTVKLSESLDSNGVAHEQLHWNKSEAFAEPQLFASLEVEPGVKLQLGNSLITAHRVIRQLPDQGAVSFQFAPRLLIPLELLPETGLLTPASRAQFQLQIIGDKQAIKDYQAWLKPKLSTAERIQTLDDGSPSINQAFERGQRFLGITSLISVILAGAAIALSSLSLNRRETSTVAVLKTIGASRRSIIKHYAGLLFSVLIFAVVLGSLIGYAIQALMAIPIQAYFQQILPQPSLWPLLTGFLTALIMTAGFSVPQIASLIKFPPVKILQGDLSSAPASRLLAGLSIILALLLLMWLQTGDMKISLFLMVAVLAVLGVFWLIGNLILTGLPYVRRKFPRLDLPKPNKRIAFLVTIFGVGLFSMLLLTTLRTDLIERWEATIPEKAPNHFLINIQPSELQRLQDFFTQHDIDASLYPMTRGRLVAINDKPVLIDNFQMRAQRLLSREFNLSATDVLPSSNKVVAGEWFADSDSTGISMEQDIAETLGLALHDQLNFDIAGEIVSLRINSIREVRWDSMQPNFFALTDKQTLENLPRTFITSIYLDKNSTFISTMLREFPTITDIDISALTQQVKDLINKVTFAVQAIFSLSLIAGIVVLLAALQSQKAERRKEMAVYKAIGASKAHLRNKLLIEFASIGAIAGFIASIMALLIGNIAAFYLFDLAPELNLLIVFLGTLGGMLLVGIAGYANMRKLIDTTPIALLQE
ncbi:MAG: Unknown protein [uncultured Thiotrichaceae bacterium]|uniref:ABC3 transporter permease C-terminal domain-containing protein n=1 Tax=uncultured Thiotrichaceae bacterium TaxID=298394 RepID=A0A6S6TTP1_9GAMM|nr:MAG: Unknown protein [uncultured Thiotrichaceae bacterium]